MAQAESEPQRAPFELVIKPVFPVMYIIVFLIALSTTTLDFIARPLPEIFSLIDGEGNRALLLFFVQGYGLFLGLYVAVHYIRFEVLEHDRTFKSRKRSVSKFAQGFEIFLRITIAFCVALKVFKWDNFENLFVFTFLLSSLLTIWYLYVKAIIRDSDIGLSPAFVNAGMAGISGISVLILGDRGFAESYSILFYMISICAILLILKSLFLAGSAIFHEAEWLVQPVSNAVKPVSDRLDRALRRKKGDKT